MEKKQMINKKCRAKNARFAKSGMFVLAIFCVFAMAILSLPSLGTPPVLTRASQKLAAASRQVRVTAANVAQVPDGKSYVIEVKQKGVAYEFDPSAGRINYARVVVRTTTGDVPFAAFIKRKFPNAEVRGWEAKRVRFTVLAAKSPGKGGLGLKNPTGQTPFTCNPIWCACQGDDDCNDMFTTNACGDTAFCVNTSSANVKCYCERP